MKSFAMLLCNLNKWEIKHEMRHRNSEQSSRAGIRLGEPLHDEFVIPYDAAKNGGGVHLVNTSDTEPLVATRCWGPEAWGPKMPKAPFETWPSTNATC